MDSDRKSKELLETVLTNIFDGDDQLFSRWLETPVPALAGEAPKTLIKTPTGCEVLERYVEKLRHGDYS